MSDQTLFGNDQVNQQVTPANNGGQQPTNVPNANPYADLLQGIRNETGAPKYATVEDALKALPHANSFIEQLKREKAEADAELTRLRGAADKTTELERTVQELLNRANNGSDKNQGVTPEEIAEVVNRTLTQRDTEASAKQNQATVIQNALKAFGTKEEAEKKFIEAAQVAGLSVKEFNDLAAKSPKVVLTMMGVTEQAVQRQHTTAPGASVVNTAGFTPAQESFVGRNKERTNVGASTSELQVERQRANKMVEELHAAGMTVHDLTNPKIYKKYFG